MLVFFALAILLTDFFLTPAQKGWNAITAMLGVVFSGISLWLMVGAASQHYSAFDNSIVIDPFFIFFGFLFLASTALVILLSVRYMEIEHEQHGEYYALMLLATAGMMFLACGNDLVVLFLALETMALSFYVLTGFLRRERRSNEAAMKYLLMGAFSSGILAYGFSILYGIAGSTHLDVIAIRLAERHHDVPGGDILIFLAIGTVAAGVFFKIAAVPFHQWAPDVYEGAPTSITAYVSVASKAASFALLLRLFLTVFWPVRVDWVMLMAAVAVLSMTIGTLAAITQNKHQAPARVFFDHAGRLHPARLRRLRESRWLAQPARPAVDGVLPLRLRVFQHWRVCRGDCAPPQRRNRRRHRRPQRPDPAQPGRRRLDADFPAVARGHSAHGRIRRQAAGVLVADRNRPLHSGDLWRCCTSCPAVYYYFRWSPPCGCASPPIR